MEIFVI